MTPATVLRTRIEWIDTDAAGIYHNSSVLRFVESAEAQLMRELEIDGYFPVAPRVRFEAQFIAPLFFDQQVTVELLIERIGTSSITFAFAVWGEAFDGRERRRAATGSYTTVHVTGHHGDQARSAPWPSEWLHKLAAVASPESSPRV